MEVVLPVLSLLKANGIHHITASKPKERCKLSKKDWRKIRKVLGWAKPLLHIDWLVTRKTNSNETQQRGLRNNNHDDNHSKLRVLSEGSTVFVSCCAELLSKRFLFSETGRWQDPEMSHWPIETEAYRNRAGGTLHTGGCPRRSRTKLNPLRNKLLRRRSKRVWARRQVERYDPSFL